MRVLNTIGRLAPADRIDRFRLDEATVRDEAMHRVGMRDFGDQSFIEGLDALLGSIGTDMEPHLVGQIALRQAIVDALVNRLLLTHERRHRPHLFQAPLRAPIIVTGLHRSGTTHLHRLLAQDVDSHAPPYWQLIAPIVPPGSVDNRRERARRSLAVRTAMMPDLSRMHSIGADTPEECFYLTASSFQSVFFWSMAPVTGYLQWYLRSDRTQKYREYRAWLQILQAQAPGKRLVLKAPEHLGALEALLGAVPEAEVVHIHRDPVTAYASYLSMAKTTQSLTVADLDVHRTAETSLDLFASELRALARARATHGDRIHDVDYTDVVADPVGAVTAIYRSLSMPMSAQFTSALRSYAASEPKDRHGVHHYRLADEGVDEDWVRRRLCSPSA